MTLISSALARLFSDPWERSLHDRIRQEPRLTSLDTTTGDPAETGQPVAALPAPASAEDKPRYDLRNMSPRDFADLTHELYLEGTLEWDEFKMVGLPSELDPRYDETIGALTGEKARPDHPKDMLGQWEQRVEFEKRYNPGAAETKTAQTVLDKLRWLNSAPLDLTA